MSMDAVANVCVNFVAAHHRRNLINYCRNCWTPLCRPKRTKRNRRQRENVRLDILHWLHHAVALTNRLNVPMKSIFCCVVSSYYFFYIHCETVLEPVIEIFGIYEKYGVVRLNALIVMIIFSTKPSQAELVLPL